MALSYLDPKNPLQPFPPVAHALRDPNGLLAVGGDLSVPRLLSAYRQGIFPWYSQGEPILWWSPDPRAVLIPKMVKRHRSLMKSLQNKPWIIFADTNFPAVITACATTRRFGQSGTWITGEIKAAYTKLFQAGFAHSLEVYEEDQLIGGLYGVALDKVFFGESMFHRQSDASKAALLALCLYLVQQDFVLIDVQQDTDHLKFMGSECWLRQNFVCFLEKNIQQIQAQTWNFSLSVEALVQAWRAYDQ
jgi:leucyl/phenylalanyl-tRNA--protein transferase